MLSVIVPVYNSAKYLERCVNSILTQTYHDLEILLVDDGSTDDSGTLCDAISLADSRVKVIHKDNGGVSSARNAGIKAAKGQYLAFVDSDDYCASDMYEKLFAKMSEGVDIVLCDFMLDYGNSQSPQSLYDVVEHNNTETIKNMILSGMGGGSVNMIIRQDIIYNNKLLFPEHLSAGEDFWFVLRLLSHARKVVKVSEPLYWYNRANEMSITHTLSMTVNNQTLRGYAECLHFIQKHEILYSLEKEMSWSILRFKTCFLFSRNDFGRIRKQVPEVNRYIKTCPILSRNMKLAMSLVCHHLDFGAYFFVLLYRLQNRIK